VLLAHALGVGRERLLLQDGVPDAAARVFQTLVAERAATGRPVAYLTGRRGFLEFELEVGPDVLVPRPESELLVEALDELLERGAVPPGPVVDRGTGSGNLALGVRGRRAVLALDLSEAALRVAGRNLARLLPAARVLLARADGLDALRPASVAAVLANPPYVDPEDFAALPEDVRHHEPRAALVPSEGSVRAMLARLLAQSRRVLVPGGWLLSELGAGQAPAALALASASGFGWTALRRDLAGHERVLLARAG
jgi:release factor glutamine methyltransferase